MYLLMKSLHVDYYRNRSTAMQLLFHEVLQVISHRCIIVFPTVKTISPHGSDSLLYATEHVGFSIKTFELR